MVLGNDSSGFLAATKLAGASEVPGQDGADPVHEPIASVPALAGVSSGFFTVNGVVISVDTAADSLGDVLDRINASVPGVRATLDPATRRLEIAAQDGAPTLSLENGSSGFLSALRIVEGTYQPLAAREAQAGGEPGYQRQDLVRRDLRAVRSSLGAVLGESFGGVPSGELANLRGRLTAAVGGVFCLLLRRRRRAPGYARATASTSTSVRAPRAPSISTSSGWTGHSREASTTCTPSCSPTTRRARRA